MELTAIEKELVGLWVASGSIDSVINHALLQLKGVNRTKEVCFATSTHQKLFNILLLDFLENVDVNLTGVKGSCLELLETACQTASFDEEGTIEFLATPIAPLRAWLDGEITEETWLPSIDQNLDLTIRRREILYICGNISKHNSARLTGAAKNLAEILGRHDIKLDTVAALPVLDDFYQKFHDDILGYQSTVIAQLLNDVRWGIHNYLQLEYIRANVRDHDDHTIYSFRIPEGVSNEFAKYCHWDLMNFVRREPYMEHFVADSALNQRY